MKHTLLCLLATFLVSFQSQASVPNCWDNPNAVPRAYLVGIDRAKLGSSKTLSALQALSYSRYVHPKSFPMFFDTKIYVDLEAPLGQWGDNRELTEAELRTAAESELATLSLKYALSIDCNGYVYPMAH